MILKTLLATFFSMMLFPYLSRCQATFNYYVSSVLGNDSFPGTSALKPKKSIESLTPLLKKHAVSKGRVSVGLQSGDVFHENLTASYSLQVGSYSSQPSRENFAI